GRELETRLLARLADRGCRRARIRPILRAAGEDMERGEEGCRSSAARPEDRAVLADEGDRGGRAVCGARRVNGFTCHWALVTGHWAFWQSRSRTLRTMPSDKCPVTSESIESALRRFRHGRGLVRLLRLELRLLDGLLIERLQLR